MHKTGHLDLSSKAISEGKYLRSRIGKRDFSRFKSITRLCGTTVHIPEKVEREPYAHITPAWGALSDGEEVLAAHSAGFLGPDISLLVKAISMENAKAIGFASAAQEKAFPLSFFTVIVGKKVAGSMIDQIPASGLSGDIWSKLAAKGIGEPSLLRLEYSGLAVNESSGKMTLMSLVYCDMPESGNFEPLDIGFERDAFAKAIRALKGAISRDMQLALSIIGYREWGSDFLRLADK